jgi:hypothetical protein
MMDSHCVRLGITARAQEVSVAVCTPTSNLKKYCRMKLQDSGKAMIYNKSWTYAVKAFNLKEGDVCMFTFIDDREVPWRRRDPFSWLRMQILKLEEE